MLYVIVCLINDKVKDFHHQLVEDVCQRFNVKRQRLQSHFTLKAPFESTDILEIEKATENFCLSHCASPFTMSGYNHFNDNVIYMDIKPSIDTRKNCEAYKNLLRTIPGLDWKRNESKKHKFHCTVVSKLSKDSFEHIWFYVNHFPYSFDCSFDNITIMRLDKDGWVVEKSYRLQEKLNS